MSKIGIGCYGTTEAKLSGPRRRPLRLPQRPPSEPAKTSANYTCRQTKYHVSASRADLEMNCHGRISFINEGLALRIAQGDRCAVARSYRAGSPGFGSRTTRVSSSLHTANLACEDQQRTGGVLCLRFLSGRVSPTGHDLEQFLLVAAAIKPLDAPAGLERAVRWGEVLP